MYFQEIAFYNSLAKTGTNIKMYFKNGKNFRKYVLLIEVRKLNAQLINILKVHSLYCKKYNMRNKPI